MKVIPWEFGRFWVTSETDPDRLPYLVDMLEYHRHGQCDCEDFRIRVKAKWDGGEIPDVKNCKHIRKVRALIPEAPKQLFRMAQFERQCRQNPQRYGVPA